MAKPSKALVRPGRSRYMNLARVGLGSAILLLSGTVDASAAELPAEARTVLEHIEANGGKLSDSDRATLRKYPKVANMVHDPAAGTARFRTVPDPASARGVRGRQCWISEGHHHAKTALGFTFYKFFHRADWCSDGQNVLGVHYREYRKEEVSSHAVWRGLEEDSVTPSPAREVRSRMRAQFENCVIKCISTTHPWVQLNLRGDGFWWPASGEN
ncbi:hypothetical protein [Streptomyces sp. Je 1-369]|uniref:hypothetical protein n=1 Tax=Streptomyces sp. Je 1-369 TaxID=2966192 RepID=UPI00228645E1|nr:hypothetical protein [Streptomyces sp. Je 1-369]WAL94316.1 hypothetical protein NOO62_07270 [Streptomyces sp. Je 1-369]